jgi:hypothetical protein
MENAQLTLIDNAIYLVLGDRVYAYDVMADAAGAYLGRYDPNHDAIVPDVQQQQEPEQDPV